MDEAGGVRNRTVDMALRCQMDDGCRLEGVQGRVECGPVADVDPAEAVGLPMADGFQRPQVGRIGEAVDVEHRHAKLADQMPAQGRTDEARAACYENSHCVDGPRDTSRAPS